MKHIKLRVNLPLPLPLPLPLLLPLLLLTTHLPAQEVFQKTYDHFFTDRANAVEVLPNGNMVLVGATGLQNSSQQNLQVVMLNEMGEKLWSKTYSNGQRTEAMDIMRTSDGNLLVVFDAFNNSGEAKASWMKISPQDGSVVWSRRALPSSRLPKISRLQDGYLLTGDFVISSTDRDAMAVKINENGDVVWYKIFGEPGYEQLGECWQDPFGFIHCSGYHIETNESQGIYARFSATGDMPGPIQRYSIGSNTDLLSHISPLENDGLLFAGNSQGFNDGNARAWTLTTDRSGNLKTSYTYGIDNKHIGVTDLITLPGDQFLLSLGRPAPSGTPAILIKINAQNDMLWQNTYKGDGTGNILWQVKPHDDGFATVGTSTSGSQTNFFLAKTDNEGKAGDCCPTASGLKRETVTPEQTAFVPEETIGFSAQNAILTVADASVIANTICLPIEVDFEIADSTLCPGECTQITLLDNIVGVSYSLNIEGAEPDPVIPGRICHTDGGNIVVTRKGSFNGCEIKLSKSVEIGSKEDIFPNAFTPNGDGANDVFRPVFPCEVVFSNLRVFSRWGELVFETDEPLTGWDGRINGLDAASDVYVWRVEYEAIRAGTQLQFVEKGDVTLLR
ncbi:MAG: gliding motility-associated C-terminal domain-containing protein [Saprospiraceae bacterium]|nr:gliding motility-associated C-terminal domain-containing protein [Saprospiraceae bacterium]